MTNGLRWHVPWLPFVIISAWDACESVLWVCAMENACYPVVILQSDFQPVGNDVQVLYICDRVLRVLGNPVQLQYYIIRTWYYSTT